MPSTMPPAQCIHPSLLHNLRFVGSYLQLFPACCRAWFLHPSAEHIFPPCLNYAHSPFWAKNVHPFHVDVDVAPCLMHNTPPMFEHALCSTLHCCIVVWPSSSSSWPVPCIILLKRAATGYYIPYTSSLASRAQSPSLSITTVQFSFYDTYISIVLILFFQQQLLYVTMEERI